MNNNIGPTCWMMLDQHVDWLWMMLEQHVGWYWTSIFDHCKSTENTLKYTFLIWYFSDFNQQHSEQKSIILTVIPYINNLQTSTEQLVLNPLTHKWKSCASPKVTKTWHNLFKKRYCLSSNSAVTDLLKNALRKNIIIYWCRKNHDSVVIWGNYASWKLSFA